MAVIVCASILLVLSILDLQKAAHQVDALGTVGSIRSLLQESELENQLTTALEPSRARDYQAEFDSLISSVNFSDWDERATDVLGPIRERQLLMNPKLDEQLTVQAVEWLEQLENRISRSELPRLRTKIFIQLGATLFLLLGSLITHLNIRSQKPPPTARKSDSDIEPFSTLPLSFTDMALKSQRRPRDSQGLSARGYTERVLQSLSNFLILAGRDGTIQMANQAVSEALGYKSGELLGRDFQDILIGEMEPPTEAYGELETYFLTKDGAEIPVVVSCSVVYDLNDMIDGLVIVAKDVTDRKAYEHRLQANETRLRHLTERLISAQEDERQRVARDLHDGMLQSIIAADLQLSSALKKWKKSQSDIEPTALNNSKKNLKEAVAQGRELIHDLRPPVLDQFGLVKSIQHEANRLTEQLNLEIDLEVPEASTEFPKQLENALHRIFQECLANIRKHSGAKKVESELRIEGRSVVLTVSDNGVGFEIDETQPGIGLQSMRERAELLGGHLELQSSPDEGTVVTARVPLQTSGC